MTKLIACIMAGNSEKFIDLCIKSVIDQVDKLIICYDSTSKDKTYNKLLSYIRGSSGGGMQKTSDRAIFNSAEESETTKQVQSLSRGGDLSSGITVSQPPQFIIIERDYQHDSSIKNANSNQRNFYLDYLKKNHLGDYCLALDADEVCDENVYRLKEVIKELETMDAINNVAVLSSPEMVHFIQDLGHEDATREKHYCPNRFFKITEDLYYPDGEHPVLNKKRETLWCPKIDFFK